jgi:uncharacterized protein (DUF697 family)
MRELSPYEQEAFSAVAAWKLEMQQQPGAFDRFSRKLQLRINRLIPEKVHQAITAAFKIVTKFMLRGADFLTSKPLETGTLEERERLVDEQIDRYKNIAMAEGAITGAGGILLGLADLPLWLTIKIKMLCHISALYGYDPGDFKERLFILNILSMTFSSPKHRQRVFRKMEHWETYVRSLADEKDAFDWRTFQQEYRDFLDLAKLLQLVPGIGAAVGAVVNNKLTDRLGETAVNAYRMRILQNQDKKPGFTRLTD